MRYNKPFKNEKSFISDKIKIIANTDYYKIIAIKDIKKDEELIIEYPKYNLFGMEVIDIEKQIQEQRKVKAEYLTKRAEELLPSGLKFDSATKEFITGQVKKKME